MKVIGDLQHKPRLCNTADRLTSQEANNDSDDEEDEDEGNHNNLEAG